MFKTKIYIEHGKNPPMFPLPSYAIVIHSASNSKSRAILMLMKSTKVQNPRRKCSAVVETNFLVAEYRIQNGIGQRTIITHAHRAPLIDGLGHETWSAT